MKILKLASEIDEEGIFLPQEIILNILSRAPVKTVLTCKCVCKPWLNLIKTTEFAQCHLSNSVPGLLVVGTVGADVNVFRTFYFDESPKIEQQKLRYKPVIELRTKKIFGSIMGSANGLLCFREISLNSEDYCISNPITREFQRFKLPEWIEKNDRDREVVTCGFGASRLSNQYKIVRIFQQRIVNQDVDDVSSISEPAWHVFTLQTRLWRIIKTPCEVLSDLICSYIGTFLDGNLYWLTKDSHETLWIVCIDLETEFFTKFPAPMVTGEFSVYLASIGVVRDRLCFCDNSPDTEMIIYLLNDYGGDDKISWNKEYVISRFPEFVGEASDPIFVVKAFEDLVIWQDHVFYQYSDRTKTTDELAVDDAYGFYPLAMSYTPSFISLRSLAAGNEKQFRRSTFPH